MIPIDSNIFNELQEEIDDFKRQAKDYLVDEELDDQEREKYSAGSLQDASDLEQLKSLLEQGNIEEACGIINKVDTYVREHIPDAVLDFIESLELNYPTWFRVKDS